MTRCTCVAALRVAVVGTALLTAGSAFAQTDYNAPWRGDFWGYVGASGGESKFRADCSRVDVFRCDKRDTGWEGYAAALATALDAVRRFAPDALVVSLGVDTFEADPISKFKLKTRDYPRIGAALAAIGCPTVLVQEGGYAVEEIGVNVAGVLGAFP